MPFISDNVGYFVVDNFGYFIVGLFLVLAARDGYGLCRPASATESVLFERDVAAAAAAAVSIQVLFLLRGWRAAAAGAVLLVVLRAGFYFLYRRSLPYVPPVRNRGDIGRRIGDKIEDWFKPPATCVEFLNYAGLGTLAPVFLDAFVVSGSTSQDGTYQRDVIFESLPSYKCADNDKYIWYSSNDQRWHIGSGGPGSASAELRVLDLGQDLEAVPTGSWEAWDGSNFVSSSVSVTKTTSNRPFESFASITARDLRDAGVDGRTSSAYATRLRKAYKELPRGPTCFRDMLALGMVPTAAQLGTCERLTVRSPGHVLTYAERRTFEEISGVTAAGRTARTLAYKMPRWYSRPWRHRLHYTLQQRLDVYDAEFAAERVAWEKLNLRVKERDAAQEAIELVEQCADESREPTNREVRDQRTLSRELEGLWKEDVEKELVRRGMVLRVLPCVEIKQ